MDDVHDRAPARKAEIVIPKRNRGRQSVAAQLAYQKQVEEFCSQIGKIRGSLDFDDSDYYCEMWVEKIDLKSLFSGICKRYTMPLINIRGRTCLNSRAGTMKRFLERESEGKTCVLLYCGDHDPSGHDISGSVISDIESLSGATGFSPDNLVVDRFGLNFDFIEAERLSWSENLVTSSGEDLANRKHPDHFKPYVQDYLARFGARKVEANALVVRPEAGRRLCLEAVCRYVPDTVLADFETRRGEAQIRARSEILQLLAAS
jgi:hypothetical protein